MADGHVLCNGKLVAKSLKLKGGRHHPFGNSGRKAHRGRPQKIPLDIVYEDDDLLVVNKPKGMVVHPAPGNPDGTLVNALLYHCAGPVGHRRGHSPRASSTALTRTRAAFSSLPKTMPPIRRSASRWRYTSIHRVYHTMVYGNLKRTRALWKSGSDATDRKKMAVYPARERGRAKYAYTGWQVLERCGNFYHCVQTKDRAHPSDSCTHGLDGASVGRGCWCMARKNASKLNGQCLHAKELGFVHPITGEHLRFDSELPEYFTRFLATLRRGTV